MHTYYCYLDCGNQRNRCHMKCTSRKLYRHSRTGAEYELPRQYLSKESQPICTGRKNVLATKIKLRNYGTSSNALLKESKKY